VPHCSQTPYCCQWIEVVISKQPQVCAWWSVCVTVRICWRVWTDFSCSSFSDSKYPVFLCCHKMSIKDLENGASQEMRSVELCLFPPLHMVSTLSHKVSASVQQPYNIYIHAFHVCSALIWRTFTPGAYMLKWWWGSGVLLCGVVVWVRNGGCGDHMQCRFLNIMAKVSCICDKHTPHTHALPQKSRCEYKYDRLVTTSYEWNVINKVVKVQSPLFKK